MQENTSRNCAPLIPSNDLMSNLFYVTVLTSFFLLASGLLNKVCLMICWLLLTLNMFKQCLYCSKALQTKALHEIQ